MIPRFANPHVLQLSTQTVSRADLEADRDVAHTEVDEDTSAVLALEHILKRTLGDFQSSHSESSQDYEQPTKRNKTVRSEGGIVIGDTVDEQPVEFRLLSKATKLVSLKPKPTPQIIVMGPSLEDDDDEAALRAERARVAAVDISWIMEESQKPFFPRPNADKVISVVPDKPMTYAQMVVFEMPRTTPLTDTRSSSFCNMSSKEQPSPHDFPPDKIHCPVISVAPSQTEPPPNQRKRKSRHKKSASEPKPLPSFWRPLQEWGGKSRGYAMGYPGSRPIPTGSVRQWRYRRDSMKKGVLCA